MGGKTTHTYDNKVAEFQVNSATYGLVVPVIIGTTRIPGNVIDYYDFKAIPHTETQSAGKGGGGKTKHTSYTYEAAVLLGLAEGPVEIGKVWADTDVYDSLAPLNLTLFNGAIGQAPWAYTQTKHPERALPYSGLAYVAGVMDLGSSGGVPQLNFEVKGLLRNTGDGWDANAADAIKLIIDDPYNGVGFGVGSIDADSLERLRRYSTAADLLISIPATETRKAYEMINDICKALNTIVFWSQNKIKFVPRCDQRLERDGVVYEPDTVPLYDLTADDFLQRGNQLVKFERVGNAETYNHVTVEFLNRANAYEKETAEAKIQVDINQRGLRSMPTVNMPFVHTKERAEYIAQQLVMDSLYGRNRYTFYLGWSHCLLEPGDFVTIYDPVISPDKIPVIIDHVEEDDEGELEIVAFGCPPGIYSPARYNTHESERYAINHNIAPGNVNPPVIFEAPPELTTTANQLEIWMGISGEGAYWGGCNIWISEDDLTYRQIGTINGPAKTGQLTALLPIGNAVDTTNTLTVSLAESRTSLMSGTKADADHLNTLCYVDGEFIAYQNADLSGNNAYNLTYLVRGAYRSMITSHDVGTQFLRLNDDTIFKLPYTENDIGRTFYLKFTSFNAWGREEQSLDQAELHSYTIKREDSIGAPGNVSKIASYTENKITNLTWPAVEDSRNIFYEVRKGASWESGQTLGKTPLTNIGVQGMGTYWVAAVWKGLYSPQPCPIAVDEAALFDNIVASYSEENGWSGTFTGGAVATHYGYLGCSLFLGGVGAFDDMPDVDAVENINLYGGAAESGIYEIPEEHIVDLGTPQPCQVYTEIEMSVQDSFGNRSKLANAETQIAVAQEDGIFDEWAPLIPGTYVGQKFKFRIVLTSQDLDATVIVPKFRWVVDMPDRIERFNGILIPAEGLTITFDKPFQIAPNVQVLLLDAQEGDVVVVPKANITKEHAFLRVKNSASWVQREVNALFIAY